MQQSVMGMEGLSHHETVATEPLLSFCMQKYAQEKLKRLEQLKAENNVALTHLQHRDQEMRQVKLKTAQLRTEVTQLKMHNICQDVDASEKKEWQLREKLPLQMEQLRVEVVQLKNNVALTHLQHRDQEMRQVKLKTAQLRTEVTQLKNRARKHHLESNKKKECQLEEMQLEMEQLRVEMAQLREENHHKTEKVLEQLRRENLDTKQCLEMATEMNKKLEKQLAKLRRHQEKQSLAEEIENSRENQSLAELGLDSSQKRSVDEDRESGTENHSQAEVGLNGSENYSLAVGRDNGFVNQRVAELGLDVPQKQTLPENGKQNTQNHSLAGVGLNGSQNHSLAQGREKGFVNHSVAELCLDISQKQTLPEHGEHNTQNHSQAEVRWDLWRIFCLAQCLPPVPIRPGLCPALGLGSLCPCRVGARGEARARATAQGDSAEGSAATGLLLCADGCFSSPCPTGALAGATKRGSCKAGRGAEGQGCVGEGAAGRHTEPHILETLPVLLLPDGLPELRCAFRAALQLLL
ncbi:interaptin-like [Colius striatus]|uniref:interaptin-like n=2 Tax=Colius striatus TaxID=57412 RepID=UPI002B1D7D33|nr:interaptin-like [Colius striatus]